jgi:hypothetical protein
VTAGDLRLDGVAVRFGLLLFWVQDKWPPLLQVDVAARDGLLGFALWPSPESVETSD